MGGGSGKSFLLERNRNFLFECARWSNQGNQTLAQMDAKLTVELTKLKTQTAAFHRAQAFDRLAEPLTLESIERINEELMRDYP